MHFRVNAQKSMVVNKVATLLFWMMMMATDGCYMSEILPSNYCFICCNFFSFKNGGHFSLILVFLCRPLIFLQAIRPDHNTIITYYLDKS